MFAVCEQLSQLLSKPEKKKLFKGKWIQAQNACDIGAPLYKMSYEILIHCEWVKCEF